jgi:hypothetical protein
LPELSRRWVADKQFEPDMLTLSPDGKWMLGFGGTEEKPTWIASEVRGDGWQEWSRDTRTPKSRLVVERNPLIAWIDGRRWVELNHTPKGFVARVRTRGVDTVDELPLSVPKYLSDFPSVLFTFPLPNEGRMGGEVGVSANGHQRDQHFVTWLIRVVPNTDGWRVEQREVVWQQADHPGYFHRCVLSPDGQRLAWNNYFTKTEARAIIVSDAEGKNPRIVYEHLYSSSDDQAGRTEAPWSRALEWTPQGDCLAFWRGEYGENGLCLLPVPIK